VITIVSGLPRSGTSLMMQMLRAGGMEILTDLERKADDDNPRGYFEWEPTKRLPKEPELIDRAEGKAVKIISQLLMSLPKSREYKVIFMQRRFTELLASQDLMLRRRGQSDDIAPELMTKAFADHLRRVDTWLRARPDLAVCRQDYHSILESPRMVAKEIQNFLGIQLDTDAMIAEVDPLLYRNRHSDQNSHHRSA
jgi:hypothetical protein